VTGKVKNAQLVEVPMGTTLRQIIYDICGGILDDREIKAVQTGGPSGGVIPEKFIDTPVSYETLLQLGSIMGSGGMLAMDKTDSMVDVAKFYLRFCVDESCGKCAPCRIGGYQMLQILDRISRGRGNAEDLVTLRRICGAMQKASLCGLGQTAPNPVLSTLRYFEEGVSGLHRGRSELCTQNEPRPSRRQRSQGNRQSTRRAMITARINDFTVEVPEGTSILDAARKVQVKIPTLCKHKDLLPTAACGLCIVRNKATGRMVRACTTPLDNNMELTTHDPDIVEVRRATLELILSNHPHECLTCGRNGECELQALAADFNITQEKIKRFVKDVPPDTSTNSIVIDFTKCIKCGRCVQVCQEMQNVWALSFLERGINTRMAPAGRHHSRGVPLREVRPVLGALPHGCHRRERRDAERVECAAGQEQDLCRADSAIRACDCGRSLRPSSRHESHAQALLGPAPAGLRGGFSTRTSRPISPSSRKPASSSNAWCTRRASCRLSPPVVRLGRTSWRRITTTSSTTSPRQSRRSRCSVCSRRPITRRR
jgi:ferredoxin